MPNIVTTPEAVSFIQEFMNFVQTYNIVGAAIGMIIAIKVGELVKSLVEDLLTPAILTPLFKKLGVEHLEDLSWNGILYGKVLARAIDFLVISIIIFILVKHIDLPTK